MTTILYIFFFGAPGELNETPGPGTDYTSDPTRAEYTLTGTRTEFTLTRSRTEYTLSKP